MYQKNSLSGWTQEKQEEMMALEQNETWELVTLPPGGEPLGASEFTLSS